MVKATEESLDVDDMVLGEFYNVTVDGQYHKNVVCTGHSLGAGYLGIIATFSTPNPRSMTYHDSFNVLILNSYIIERVERNKGGK